MAVEFIFLAALLDAIDGRVARALKAESKIGGQLDSLADFFNFGIAPKVAVGQQVLGGETIIADLADTDNQIQRVADPI